MPRAKKYHTNEDKAIANRAKSRKHYNKKKAINSSEPAKHPGRPQKYHTIHEKQIASKAKNKRYYARNKSLVRVRQSVRHKETQDRNAFVPPVAIPHHLGSVKLTGAAIVSSPGLHNEAQETTPEYNHDTNIHHWCVRLEALAARLQEHIKKSPREYLEHVYASYAFTHRKDDIRNEITVMSKLQKSVHRSHGNILQLAGVGPELQRADDMSNQVRQIISWLEDILVWAMCDTNTLITMHNRQELVFQTSYYIT